jgi:hypothetical protein
MTPLAVSQVDPAVLVMERTMAEQGVGFDEARRGRPSQLATSSSAVNRTPGSAQNNNTMDRTRHG